jgi:hypothetical protein
MYRKMAPRKKYISGSGCREGQPRVNVSPTFSSIGSFVSTELIRMQFIICIIVMVAITKAA